MGIILAIVMLVVGFVMLIKGADWFVDGSAGIAARFGIPQLVIGLTIVAMGTSAPEAAVSITAALNGNAGITIGNVLGSNILNVLIILGVTAVITTISVQKSTVKIELPFFLLVSVVLMWIGFTGNVIVLWEGILLWVFFIIYLVYLLVMAKKGKSEGDNAKQKPIWLQIILLIVGVVCIVFGSDFTVDGATEIATVLGMDDRLIGLTIVAFGTSLPELVTSITAARKGQADIAIGNVVGSNLFNILFVVGTTAIITPVAYKMNFMIDAVVSLLAGVLLWFGVFKDYKLKRPIGVVMLLGYAAYFVYLLMFGN